MQPLHRLFIAAFTPALLIGVTLAGQVQAQSRSASAFLSSLAQTPSLNAGTVPGNGDGNPYGVAIVPAGFPAGGNTRPGDILVSNFNASSGKQGTGRTIVSVSPSGKTSLFFQGPPSLGRLGLTTALVALRSGIVVVGNMPTTDGTSATVEAGSLLFIDKSGHILLNLKDPAFVNGPWDMTADDRFTNRPILYFSNILNGTVVRLNLHVIQGRPTIESLTLVGSGFPWRPDPNALEVGPTGLALSHNHHSLYVADTTRNQIRLLRHVDTATGDGQGSGSLVASGGSLEGPLALTWAPNGDLITSNGDASGPAHTKRNINRVVEINLRQHTIVDSLQLDTTGTPGAIFGLAVTRLAGKEALVYVDDNSNTLQARLVK
ncbi:MAG TPA: hypothetical protein VFB34_11605 [Chloroflexota bacterium]|nr:hypothetical protein [Chloroflexota bacterium]